MSTRLTTEMDEIRSLTERNRQCASPEVEAELVGLRMAAGQALVARGGHGASPPPRPEDLFPDVRGLPEIDRASLGADTLRAGILCHGALVVRGLYDTGQLARLESAAAVDEPAQDDRLGCCPGTLFLLLEIYRECGLLESVRDYLDGAPLLFGERAKLRHHQRGRDSYAAIPWHQDAAFFGGRFGAVNCWAAVTPCGEDNPGLSIIPRRTETFHGWNPQEGHAPLDYGRALPEAQLELMTMGCTPADCHLQPGDAVLFDEMTVHQTLLRPWRRDDQLVTISWFFGASLFPAWGTPLAV